MPRFKLQLEYQGTRYRGWQAQANARTVQGEIQEAIREVTGRDDFELYGSGRTDAGVHALHQVAHLEIALRIPPEDLRRRVNDKLPSDIHVIRLDTAEPRFHARHHATGRSYLYQISRRRTAFGKKLVWWVREDLDLQKMRLGSERFVGMKDYRSFSDDDPSKKSTRVQIEKIELREVSDLILIRVEGSHFIWKMVRRIVGVLVEAGKGNLTAAEIEKFLRTKSAEPARWTAPASGLFLERVYYPGDPKLERLEPVLRVRGGSADASPDSMS